MDEKKTKQRKKRINPLITAGDRACYVYFDCEFTGLRKNTTLISIGFADCDGHTFYAEFTDYDHSQIDEWIEENVINNLQNPDTVLEGDEWTVVGDSETIREELSKWLGEFIISKGKTVQFVSDVCHYDFVLLLDLLIGNPNDTVFTLPKWISPCCVDLNQDIATSLYRTVPEGKTSEEFNENYVPIRTAFDIDRDACAEGIREFTFKGMKHNSLFDAMVIRAIHQNLWKLEN